MNNAVPYSIGKLLFKIYPEEKARKIMGFKEKSIKPNDSSKTG
jgi:hypothetical protein